MDFRVFPDVKSQLRGIRFASKQELAAKRIVSSFDADCESKERQLCLEIGEELVKERQFARAVVLYLVDESMC
ncbi:hypothetical protein DPMN_100070 [Dreissena polymorpha]|uniref:Uncharacterized protein n=1 Tax=Dreissena polymorpha TaxID=45954 RepID=A0A9D4LGT6_DREPO|nr:hypothetical protein DPMN_100070 [Dreissena polymorpha]